VLNQPWKLVVCLSLCRTCVCYCSTSSRRLIHTLCHRVRIGFPSPFPVPDGAPVGITVTNVSSHALLVEWSPPYVPNGVITAYTIYINYNNGTSEDERVMDGSTLNYTLDHLSPHQLVSVHMTANTSVGEGPRSTTADGRTDPTGIKLQDLWLFYMD